MDHIYINQIRCYGYTGALPEEQVLGQWFEVDLALGLDFTQAGRSDRLEDTLDYCQVITTVTELVQSSRFALLERLAAAIGDAVLAIPHDRAPIQQVQVRLTKLTPPIPNFSGTITVEIVRSRQ